MMTAFKKAGLSAWVSLAALAFTTLVISTCKQEPQSALPAPAKEGVLTINGTKEGIFYTADVYKYASAVPNADQLDYITSMFEIIGTWADQTSYSTREINLKTVNDDTVFMSDGKFLVILTGINSDAGLVRYKASVPFIGGCATIDYADMGTATVKQDEPDATRRTVTFDLNYEGAPQAPPYQEAVDGGYAKRPTDPMRRGHIFGGWFTDADCMEKWDFDKDVVKKDTALYAKWTQIFHTVTFDLNYDEAPEAPAPLPVAYESTAAEPSPAPQRTGYTFGGWYTSTDCTTKWDFDTPIVTGNLHLYAKWTPIFYAVTFDWNYTGAPAPPVSPPIAYGSKVAEPPPADRPQLWITGQSSSAYSDAAVVEASEQWSTMLLAR